MQLQLSLRTTEISGFKEKIYKSNTAMQTALATVTVYSDLSCPLASLPANPQTRSLSLRSNTSQDRIFSELQLLTTTIQQALKAAGLSQSPNDQLAARQSRNLHNLAKAAQKFHSSASSTASTMYGRTHPAYAPVPAWSSLYGTQLPNNDPRYIYGMTMPMPMPMGPGGPAVYPNLGSYVSGPPPDMHYAQEAHRLGVLNQMMPAPHLMPPQRQWTGDSGWAGGSEIGGLDSAQRDRIERWNQSSTTFGGTNGKVLLFQRV